MESGVAEVAGLSGAAGAAAAEPDFAVVCSFLEVFGAAAQLEPLSAPDLIRMLDDAHEVPTPLKDLFGKLLRRATKGFRPNDWEKCLIKFCHRNSHRQDAWELERFGYRKANMGVKLRVLKNLLEYQFVCNAKFKIAVNKMDNHGLRLNPIGRDDKGRCYWMQRDRRANVRLYREDQDEETWSLIASDRAGLVEVIAALKSGKCPSDSPPEPLLNEDSNSVGSPYIQPQPSGDDIAVNNESSHVPDEDQNVERDEEMANSVPDVEKRLDAVGVPKDSTDAVDLSPRKTELPTVNNTNETVENIAPKTGSPSNTEKVQEECMNESIEAGSPVQNTKDECDSITKSEDIKSLETSNTDDAEKIPEIKKPLNVDMETENVETNGAQSGEESHLDSEENKTSAVTECVGEEIEEKVMIVKGDGSGAECESFPNYFFSEAIEEEVMYVYGEGSGFDCLTGNPKVEAVSADSDRNNVESTSGIVSDDRVQNLSFRRIENPAENSREEESSTSNNIRSEGDDRDESTSVKSVDSAERDSDVNDAKLAPLPVTKRFLQNIPKAISEKLETNSIPNKTKLWSVDSLCSSTPVCESLVVTENNSTNSASETVLVNKNSLLDKNEIPSVIDAPSSSALKDVNKSERIEIDKLKGEGLSLNVSLNSEKPVGDSKVNVDSTICDKSESGNNEMKPDNSNARSIDSVESSDSLSSSNSAPQIDVDKKIGDKSPIHSNHLRKDKEENTSDIKDVVLQIGTKERSEDELQTRSDSDILTSDKLENVKDHIDSSQSDKSMKYENDNNAEAESENSVFIKKEEEIVQTQENSNIKNANKDDSIKSHSQEDAKIEDILIKSNKHKTDPNDDSLDESKKKYSDSLSSKKIKIGDDNLGNDSVVGHAAQAAGKIETNFEIEKSLDNSSDNVSGNSSSVLLGKIDNKKLSGMQNSNSELTDETESEEPIKMNLNPSVSIKKIENEDIKNQMNDVEESVKSNLIMKKDGKMSELKINQIEKENNEINTEGSNENSNLEIQSKVATPSKLKGSNKKSKKSENAPNEIIESPKIEAEELKIVQVKRTRRSESLKDTKLSDLIKLADTEMLNSALKANKRSGNKKPPEEETKEPTIEDAKESKPVKEMRSRKRGRDESASQSEGDGLDVQKSKKIKTKQKKLVIKHRKKVEEKKSVQDSSSDEEVDSKTSKGKKTEVTGKTEKESGKTKKRSKHKGTSKSKSISDAAADIDDDVPVRQSRRIAQLKIKEEAQRRQMEEVALREMKEQHKKKVSKSQTDHDWKESSAEESDATKDVKPGKKKKKGDKWHKKLLGWNSSSGGNETDSEPGEPEDDFDEAEEEDILAPKSDHEFSPESDVECDEAVPVRRARTLKKEDGGDEDVDGGCVHCGKADHPEWILLCDSCDAGWHASCLKPVLFLVPEGEWFCPPCNHKKLLSALEKELEKYDEQIKDVEAADLMHKTTVSNQLASKEEESESNSEDSDGSDKSVKSSSGSSSSASSSDDEKIYRLRERRQLPVSYRFKEYDQLISSAIKEEYKEDENSCAGNQGRGKDISTIIEADKEEKKAMLQATGQGDPEEVEARRKAAARTRRRPRKLNSLEVISDDCDDNSDEDFKEAGYSTSTSEAISSASDQSSSSHSSDSLPVRRSLRPSNPSKGKRRIVDSPERKKKSRRLFDDESTSESSGTKDWGGSKKKKSRKSKRSHSTSKRTKKKKREKQNDNDDDEDDLGSGGKKERGRAKIKYGGLSDSSRSSHDWSPAHRTRQRKYNYMELPNTESEEEAHKPSGKHMDSSDEYKGESDSGSDSDSSGRGKKRFFDDDIKNFQASKETYQKQLESLGSLVPIVKLSDISPIKNDNAVLSMSDSQEQGVEASLNQEISPSKLKDNRARRGRGFRSSGNMKRNINQSLDGTELHMDPEREASLQRIAMLKERGLLKDGDSIESFQSTGGPDDTGTLNHDGLPTDALRIPIKPAPVMTQFQIEREKKRKEREEKLLEKEKRKEERLKKKEEKIQQKEQRAKEREEKKLARIANKDQAKVNRKIMRPEFMSGQTPLNLNISGPIPIANPPGNFPRNLMQVRQPLAYPQGMTNIRGPMPRSSNPIRMKMDHSNFPTHHFSKEGGSPIPILGSESRDPMLAYRRSQMEDYGLHIKQNEMSTGEDLSGQMVSFEERKAIELRQQAFPLDSRKAFQGGPRLPFAALREATSNMDSHPGNRSIPPGYALDSTGTAIMRGDIVIRPPLNSVNDNVNNSHPNRNGIPITDLSMDRSGFNRQLLAGDDSSLDDNIAHGSGQGVLAPKRRGRGPGKKTLTRHATSAIPTNVSNDGSSSSPASSPLNEGTLTVAGAPQPFRPNVDPPSVITRMLHMMPPPYRGSSMYNNSGAMYGPPRPPSNNLSMSGVYRPHHPHPLDPSPSGGGPISMTSPERSSPQAQYPPFQSPSYYPPTSTPPHLGPYPPPHGRFPPHISGPPSRSSTPHSIPDPSEVDDKSKIFQDQPEPAQFIKSEIKQEPDSITIKQSLSPTEELEESSNIDRRSEGIDDSPSNLSTDAIPPPTRPTHPQLKHTDSKTERPRGRIALTAAARYPQGPYAPQYGPYAPHPPPASDVPYLHSQLHSLHPSIHQNSPPPPISQIHRAIYPSPHLPSAHVAPIQIPPRPPLVPLPSVEPTRLDATPRIPAQPSVPTTNPHTEEEPGEFGGLVSYFSSQQEDDIDT